MKTGKFLIIIICSFAVYANSLSGGFVYDDRETIIENSFVKDLTNFSHLFDQEYFKSREVSYRPGVTATIMIDYHVWGGNPLGFHLTNIILHSLNSLLLYVFLSRLNQKLAFTATLFFLSHPVLTESVNCISFREDLLTFFFFCLSLILYSQVAGKRRSVLLYIASCLSFFFALLSKEMAITLPLIIILLDLYSGVSIVRNRKYVGYGLVVLVYMYLRFVKFYNPTELELIDAQSLSHRLIQIPAILGQYYRLFLFPINLSNEYPKEIQHYWIYVSGLSAILITLFTLKKIKQNIYFFGFFWVLLTLMTVLNIAPIINPVAERYLYLPIAGFSMVFASFIHKQKGYSRVLSVMLVLISFFVLNINRSKLWHDDIVLWTDAIKKTPGSERAHFNLASVYMEKGRFDEALIENNIALKYSPLDAQAYSNRGLTYAEMGETDKAMRDYGTALSIDPKIINVHHNMGEIHLKSGNLLKAKEEFEKEMQLHFSEITKYKLYGIYIDIGNEAFEKRDFSSAEMNYKHAIGLVKEREEAYINLALTYSKTGDLDAAIKVYNDLLKIRTELAPMVREKIHKLNQLKK